MWRKISKYEIKVRNCKYFVLSRWELVGIESRKMVTEFSYEIANCYSSHLQRLQSSLSPVSCNCPSVCNERKEILDSRRSLVVQTALVSWTIIHWCNGRSVPRCLTDGSVSENEIALSPEFIFKTVEGWNKLFHLSSSFKGIANTRIYRIFSNLIRT
jgi:hypothetical protein